METQNIIYDLSSDDAAWWKELLKKERPKIIAKPRSYVSDFLKESPLNLESLQTNVTNEIFRVREACWDKYINDEVEFHRHVIRKLVNERKLPRHILNFVNEQSATYNAAGTKDDDEISQLAGTVGDFCGRIMPFLYQLSLSTTNSRRSRAGQTFEEIIDNIMTAFGYPYVSQGQLGTSFYTENGLGKLVDGIIPGPEQYMQDRSKCQIITMKTTLRERWQEVVEEISRTNIPHAYLLTLDQNLTESSLDTMANHNITVVACDEIKELFDKQKNVISFTELFNKHIPHTLSYWNMINKDHIC
jgi:EcoRII C terminal